MARFNNSKFVTVDKPSFGNGNFELFPKEMPDKLITQPNSRTTILAKIFERGTDIGFGYVPLSRPMTNLEMVQKTLKEESTIFTEDVTR